MVQQSLNVACSDGASQVLWEDGERCSALAGDLTTMATGSPCCLLPLPPTTRRGQDSIASRTNTS
jgi:hypothetical protein